MTIAPDYCDLCNAFNTPLYIPLSRYSAIVKTLMAGAVCSRHKTDRKSRYNFRPGSWIGRSMGNGDWYVLGSLTRVLVQLS